MGLQIAPAEEGFQIILGMARSGHVVRNNDNPGGGAPEACSEISRLRSSKPVQPLCLPTFSFENLCAPEIYKGRRCLHSRSATLHSPCFLFHQTLSSILSTMLARIKTSSRVHWSRAALSFVIVRNRPSSEISSSSATR